MKTSYLGMSAPRSLLSPHYPAVGLCINSHLLQEAASLLWAEGGTDLWVRHNVVRNHFIAMATAGTKVIWFLGLK